MPHITGSSALVAGVALGLALHLLIGLLVLLTRTPRPAGSGALPAPPDDLPPGLVAFVVSGLQDVRTAATATVLDLAARGFVVLDQAGPHPATTTFAVVPPSAVSRAGLTPAEGVVLGWGQSIARRSTARLREFDEQAARGDRWAALLERALLAQARSAGLCRPRAGRGLRRGLTVATLLPPCLTGAALADEGWTTTALPWVFLALWLLSLGTVLRPAITTLAGPRLTREGRAVAARWIGYGSVLGQDETLRAQPPRAARGRGRSLAYGYALAVVPAIEQALALPPELGPARPVPTVADPAFRPRVAGRPPLDRRSAPAPASRRPAHAATGADPVVPRPRPPAR